MTTLDASGASPPGTYRPTRRTGIQRSVTVPPGHHRDVDRLAPLRFVDQPNAADRLGEGRANGGIQRGQRLGEGGGRHSRDGHVDPIEAQRRVPYRRVTPHLDIADDRCDGAHRGPDVHLCPGQHLAEIGGLDGQVDAAQHGPSLRAAVDNSRRRTPVATVDRDRAHCVVSARPRAVARRGLAAAHLRAPLSSDDRRLAREHPAGIRCAVDPPGHRDLRGRRVRRGGDDGRDRQSASLSGRDLRPAHDRIATLPGAGGAALGPAVPAGRGGVAGRDGRRRLARSWSPRPARSSSNTSRSSARSSGESTDVTLAAEPVPASYQLAGLMRLTREDRQNLLAAPTGRPSVARRDWC